MNALAWILATTSAAAGVDYGWQKTPEGEVEYVIQIEPELVNALLSGQDITSEIPPELAGVRKFRIRVGSGPVRKTPLTVEDLVRIRESSGLFPADSPARGARDDLGPDASSAPLHSDTPLGARGDSPPRDYQTIPNPWATGTGRPGDDHRALPSEAAGTGGGPASIRIPHESPTAGLPHAVGPRQPTPAEASVNDRGGRFHSPLAPRYPDGTGTEGTPHLADPRAAVREGGLAIPPPPGSDPRVADDRGNFTRDRQTPPPRPEVPNRYGAGIGGPRESTGGGRIGRDAAESSPGTTVPRFDTRDREPLRPTGEDSGALGPQALSTPRPLKIASFDSPTEEGNLAGQAMSKPTLPESMAQQPYKPWGWLTVSLLALFASVSANVYLGWIALDLHHRYRSAVLQMTDAAALGV